MTETTNRRTELRIAQGAWAGLKQDLFTSVLDFRPLPPLRLDSVPLARSLPGALRDRLKWLPHAAVVTFAGLVLLVDVREGPGGVAGLFYLLGHSLVLFAALLMTLFRPVTAWWLSGLAGLTGMFAGAGIGSWPWSAAGFVTHLAVMVLVAMRSRPRVAVEMWVVTLVVGSAVDVLIGYGGSTAAPMAVFSGVALLTTVTVCGWWRTRERVVVQETITAQERSRRTVLEERATIARELHDVVAHHMSVIAIQAEAAPYRVEEAPAELVKSFAVIRENAVAALTELRRVLGVVRSETPHPFADEGPEAPQPTLANLGSLLDNVRAAGLDVDSVVTGSVRPLPQGVELSAYRIVQEALSNALRHAPGATAVVEVSYVLGGLGLRVVNGPPSEAARPSPGAGHGVLGMQERVAMLGGEMNAQPTPDGGYEVAVFVPVAAPEPSAASAASASSASSEAPTVAVPAVTDGRGVNLFKEGSA
ncbi:sensor histidine kinase [Streptomyces thermolineatus]|uniref:sensor histidine kinase n=1 Tax=Streptomyces thermolineatus TaxID=44033 RepID=UPI003850A106